MAGRAYLGQSLGFDLADAFASERQPATDLLERELAVERFLY
jgi:hypothetical protein